MCQSNQLKTRKFDDIEVVPALEFASTSGWSGSKGVIPPQIVNLYMIDGMDMTLKV